MIKACCNTSCYSSNFSLIGIITKNMIICSGGVSAHALTVTIHDCYGGSCAIGKSNLYRQ